jgi:coproporphyrinogen III oxidase-like Fe-S oxidoreductase/sulfatase maturation enzyme AslB (radical SAM superfamily)
MTAFTDLRLTPTTLRAAGPARVHYAMGHLAISQSPAERERVDGELRIHAAAALRAWRKRAAQPYAPECLTVNLGNQCNLRCSYCFSAVEGLAGPPVPADPRILSAAAALVAGHCREKGLPFQLVVHGGGEPTVHWSELERAVAVTRAAAVGSGIGWRAYIATNGALPEERSRWLAGNFTEVGLSCDGPPDVQNRQRPTALGGPTADVVARTARCLHECGCAFAIRTTIMPATVERQAEIVAWLNERLGASRIRFEPVYGAGAAEPVFQPEQAGWFVRHFLLAEREARRRGCDLTLSDVRLDELHGPHCHALKDVLQLLPDGSLSACFVECGGQGPMTIGGFDARAGKLRIDYRLAMELKRRGLSVPSRCRSCINVLHCARECPEVCLVARRFPRDPGFRCLVAKGLAAAWLGAAAGLELATPVPCPRRRIRELLAEVPAGIDTAAVAAQLRRGARRYAIDSRVLPQPPWAARGFTDSPDGAFQRLVALTGGRQRDLPMSVYVHVPFCDARCGFCDCLAEPLADGNRERETVFGAALDAEIDAWTESGRFRHRPVTTLHFGGGTPTWINPKLLAGIVRKLRDRLEIAGDTEWAIESTSSALDDARLRTLREIGFRRLHVGVQTLEDTVRSAMGRREPGARVLARLEAALEAGFVVTADLMYGLPGESAAGWMRTLETLVALGLDGMSLYGLHVTERNRRFLERRGWAGRNPVREFILFASAEQFLLRHGYAKNHFSHFARKRDRNLYYTHVLRNEDLLAMGPTADGVFAAAPGLQGGLEETSSRSGIRQAVRELMCGGLGVDSIRAVKSAPALRRWKAAGLLVPVSDTTWQLTASGSWAISEMIADLKS